MIYTLYNRPGSGGFVVEAALTLAGAPFELIELDSKAGTPLPESFRETNPWGQLPTLILPNGTTMTETSAILVHLALCFPDKHLAPPPGTSAHGAFLRWTTFANVNLYEAVVRRGYPFRFTDDPEGYDALRSAAIRRMREALALIDAHVEGPFLLGEEMTVADIYIAMFFIWHRGGIEPSRAGADHRAHAPPSPSDRSGGRLRAITEPRHWRKCNRQRSSPAPGACGSLKTRTLRGYILSPSGSRLYSG